MKGLRHFFPEPPIQTVDLTVRGIGVQERMAPGLIDRREGTGDYLMMLFYDAVSIGAGGEVWSCPRNTFMIWTPGRAQYYGSGTQPFTHSWIHCDGRLIKGFLAMTRLPRNTPFAIPDPVVMERCLLAVYEELARHARPDGIIVRNLLENGLRETARDVRRVRDSPDDTPAVFLAVRHMIESEYARPLTLPDLARKASLSVPHFCAQFKRYFGVPAIDYLIRQRMHRAAYLLQDRNARVSEVARQVGYEDLFHFSKMFKKHFGASPRQRRRGTGPEAGRAARERDPRVPSSTRRA